MYEAGQVENVGTHMVGVGESADWLEYVLAVGKAKKEKVFILLRNTDGLTYERKVKVKRNKVSDQHIYFIHSGQATLAQLKSHWAGEGSVEVHTF